MSRRLVWSALPLVLALLGLSELGRGAWIHAKAWVAQSLLQSAWSRAEAGEATAKPWPWADTWPVLRLQAPAQGVDLIVLDGVHGASLPFGPGLAAGSVTPPDAGDVLLAGHRDTHFRFLAEVRAGDELRLLTPDGLSYRYHVSSKRVIDAERTPLPLRVGSRRLLLVTCYPFDAVLPGGSKRYVVTAVPVAADRPVKKDAV